MTQPKSPICFACKNRTGEINGEGRITCDAYPDGIPDQIFNNAWDHRKHATGDRGIKFEQDDTLDQATVDVVIAEAFNPGT